MKLSAASGRLKLIVILLLLVGLGVFFQNCGQPQEFQKQAPGADALSPVRMEVAFDNFLSDGTTQVVRFDDAGNALDAHDGEIKRFQDKFYLYGTSYDCGFQWQDPTKPFCGFKAYSSSDLKHWKDEGFLFDATHDLWQRRCRDTIGCFRPHVIYNAQTHLYVLWINELSFEASHNYRVFTSTSPTGPFTEVGSAVLGVASNPGHLVNGDFNLFLDDDGSAYVVFTNVTSGFQLHVQKLNSQFTSGVGSAVAVPGTASVEAPILFRRGNFYYIFYGPGCAYCRGTPTLYKISNAPLGVWSDPSSLATNQVSALSCGGQPTAVFTINEGSSRMFIYMSDLWNSWRLYTDAPPVGWANQGLANYFWGPLSFAEDGTIQTLSCAASVHLTINHMSTEPPASAEYLDQSSGQTRFRNFCDIGDFSGAFQRVQTFRSSRGGILKEVNFTTFKAGPDSHEPLYQPPLPNSDLIVEIVKLNAGHTVITQRLANFTVPISSVGFSPRKIAVYPQLPIQSEEEVGILVHSASTIGCYGFDYSDEDPYPRGEALYSNNAGASFSREVGRDLKFEAIVVP